MPDLLMYAKGPVSFLYQDMPGQTAGSIKRTKVKQLLWGDWVRVTGDDAQAGWKCVSYGKKPYLMKAADLQAERVLEIIFLDVGQGDGAILTEPGAHENPRIIVVDAGAGSNMSGFLNWRFRDFPESGALYGCVITHSDSDHYEGFRAVFKNPKFNIANVWHNGIIERAGPDLLGPATDGYLTDIRPTHAEAVALLADDALCNGKRYPALLRAVLETHPSVQIWALGDRHGVQEAGKTYLPGFAPSDAGALELEVLGPVVEPDNSGKPRLRQFGATGSETSFSESVTKNGHSVILRGTFNGFSFLMGGDLNRASETALVLHYGGATVPKPLATGTDAAQAALKDPAVVARASARLSADLMKTCHHGSSDVTEAFPAAVQPAAFVISSGDEEGYVHPRPDILGMLGRLGQGPRPLLLSTELLRSTRERGDPKLADKLQKVTEDIAAEKAKGSAADKALLKRLGSEQKTLKKQMTYRNVGVYGAINLRTDGKTAVIAFRKESGKPTERWFYYELVRATADGPFLPVLKGE